MWSVEGGEIGSVADEDGAYTLNDVQIGSGIIVSAIGYEDLTLFADTETLNFELTPSVVQMTELEVLASRAGPKNCCCIHRCHCRGNCVEAWALKIFLSL